MQHHHLQLMHINQAITFKTRAIDICAYRRTNYLQLYLEYWYMIHHWRTFFHHIMVNVKNIRVVTFHERSRTKSADGEHIFVCKHCWGGNENVMVDAWKCKNGLVRNNCSWWKVEVAMVLIKENFKEHDWGGLV